MQSITWQKPGHQSHLSISLEIRSGSSRPTSNFDIRRPNSPPNVMDPSRSSKKYLPLPTKFNCLCHGAYTTCSTPPSFHHIKKLQHTDPTFPNHHLTWLTAKKNMRWSVSSTTNIMVGLDNFNISSNGEDTPKVTTRESQLTRCTPQSSSNSIIDTSL